MKELNVDKRFCKEALDGLKSYGNMDLTIKFLERIKHPRKNSLTQMWLDIEEWLSKGSDFDCITLLEYVDDLKMYGKQRIFLFRFECKEPILQLSNDDYVRGMVGEVFDKPIYEWQIDKPTLVHVKRTKDLYSKDSLLVFKFIEMRKFDLQIDNIIEQFEERSTNFFIINLSKGYAELRLQQLPTNALLNLREEYDLFIEEIKKCLDKIFVCFKPITLERVMQTIISVPIFKITRTVFVAGQKYNNSSSTFLIIVNHLFRNPRVNYISGYWKSESKLYFSLYGNSNSIEIGGIADPNRIRKLLQKIVNIYNHPPKKERGFGLMDNLYQKLDGQPRAQAFVLSAGVVAALLIWIIIDGIGNYFFEEGIQNILGGIPYIVLEILIEIFWIIVYYGWYRTIRSFKELKHLSPIQIWRIVMDAKKNKNRIREEINTPITSHYKTN